MEMDENTVKVVGNGDWKDGGVRCVEGGENIVVTSGSSTTKVVLLHRFEYYEFTVNTSSGMIIIQFSLIYRINQRLFG
jgi:hypothetical protein